MLPGGILRGLVAVPNRSSSVLLAFSCSRLDAHQPQTSTAQTLMVDMIRGESAGRLFSCQWISFCEYVVEQSMLRQQVCDVFHVLDEPFRSQY